MADWSQLPPELLLLIGKRLEAEFGVLRFRSVCSSWRSSVSPKVSPYLLPMYLPSAYGYNSDYDRIPITRHTFYLVRLPHGGQTHAPACWFIRIRDGTDGAKMQLWDPFLNSELKPLPGNFPKVLDLTNFQVFELSHVYVGHFYADIGHPLVPIEREFTTKLHFLRSCTDSDDYMILAKFWCLAVLRVGEKWKFFENLKDIEDTIYFNGKFYVVDREGRTIVIDQSLDVSFIGCVVSGRRRAKRVLVKSDGSLLAVEKLFNTYGEDPIVLEDKDLAGFNVFKMNEEEQRWVEMESIQDQILFLCFHQAISAPGFEFGWCRGNLIFFSGYSKSRNRCVFVFDLETSTVSPLKDCPAYCNLFWCSTEIVTNSTHSVASTSSETEYKYPESDLAISATASPAAKEVDSEHPSPMSKCSFKFCCF